MNKIVKIFGLVLVVMFFSLYFSKYNIDYNQNKKILTEEAIKHYEKDLKEGNDINPSNYIEKEKNYNNKVSRLGLKTSQMIENVFKSGMKYFMKYLDHLEND